MTPVVYLFFATPDSFVAAPLFARVQHPQIPATAFSASEFRYQFPPTGLFFHFHPCTPLPGSGATHTSRLWCAGGFPIQIHFLSQSILSNNSEFFPNPRGEPRFQAP